MALALGTNAGFCATSPVDDPAGSVSGQEAFINAFQDTSPATAIKITELGVWIERSAASALTLTLALYNHDADNIRPGNIVVQTTADASSSGVSWIKSGVLDVAITPSTKYWIVVSCESGVTGTVYKNQSTLAGMTYRWKNYETPLPDPFGVANTVANNIYSMYAVWKAASVSGTNFQVNIGDVWKEVPAMQVNIGDTWKAVASAQVNIGDTWKEVF